MDKVVLYEVESSKIRISMLLYFNEKDELVFDGYDIGPAVKEIYGDSDYEYTYTISWDEVVKMAEVLQVELSNRRLFLEHLKNMFQGNDAYSKFGKFLKESGLKYGQSTWH
ncbi:hypothetical protein [Lentiprolixibacter aurantiacus]|uniref:Uncharacterized protein n=1 Tax=Lentiprolixibacter aurantiacus TaxID=2993939 RepID=A0AAE3MLL0_9FLAO|nr:hypothetical protein [Lentiprolixibacter aurantiacus]MCX2720011.1 hypothetical protein [Lentiprolixibacter aurantiacus]